MGLIADAFRHAFRDFVTDGVPASGANNPRKAEIRPIGQVIEDAIGDTDVDGKVAAERQAREQAVANEAAARQTGDNALSNRIDALAGAQKKAPVVAATTTNGTLASAFQNGAVIDGVTLVTGNRILIKDQTTASQNGIYTVNASGAPTRATDADSEAELIGATVYVLGGTANGGKTFGLVTGAPIVVATTPLTFVQTGGDPDGLAGVVGDLENDVGAFSGEVVAARLGDPTLGAGRARDQVAMRADNPARRTLHDPDFLFKTVIGDKVVSGRDQDGAPFDPGAGLLPIVYESGGSVFDEDGILVGDGSIYPLSAPRVVTRLSGQAIASRPMMGPTHKVAYNLRNPGSTLWPDTRNILLCIPVHGQSNARGSHAVPPLLTTPISYRLMMLGPDIWMGIVDMAEDPFPAGMTLQPYRATTHSLGANGQTLHGGLAQWLDERALPVSNLRLATFTSAVGGVGIGSLNKGNHCYSLLLSAVTRIKAIADANGWVCVVPCVLWMQGEGDVSNATYGTLLQALRDDLDSDIRAITGQMREISLVCAQPSSFYGFSSANMQAIKAMLERHENSDGEIVLAGPTYNIEFGSDYLHHTALGNVELGRMLSRAMEASVFGNGWEPLRPVSVIGSGSSVVVTFTGTEGALQFQSPTVTPKVNRGFVYSDGAGRTITDVQITGPNQITVSLSGAIGSSPRLAYASSGHDSPRAEPTIPRGEVRDSGAVTKWCVHFEKEVSI